jgi:hypothetical protein
MPDACTSAGRAKKIGVRGLSAFAWLVVAAIPIALLAPGCQGRECESDGYKDYGYAPGEGHLVDQNTWETTPNDATWLPFGPYHLWGLHPVGLEGRDILLVQGYYSADPNPNTPGSNFTIGSGNGLTFTVLDDSRTIIVDNQTCAPTYVRVVVVADPLPPSATGADSGATGVIDFDAGNAEAGGVDAGDLDAADLDAADASD